MGKKKNKKRAAAQAGQTGPDEQPRTKMKRKQYEKEMASCTVSLSPCRSG